MQLRLVAVRRSCVAAAGGQVEGAADLFIEQNIFCVACDTVICTDISKDGALSGTNTELYKTILSKYELNLIASGGVTSIDDVKELRASGVYGAIVGKAIYTGNIDLVEAIKVGEGN